MARIGWVRAALLAGLVTALGTTAWLRSEAEPRAKAKSRTPETPPGVEHGAPIRALPPVVFVRANQGTNDEATATAATQAAEEASEPSLPELSIQDQREYYDASFAAEPVDGDWATSTEPQLRTELLQLDTGSSRLVRLECRSTFCKAQIAHDAEHDSEAYARALVAEKLTLWKGSMLWDSEPGRDGKTDTFVYFSRSNDLPPIP